MSEHRLNEIVIERPRGGMRISLKKLTGYKKALKKITDEASEDGLLRPYLVKTRKRTKHFSDHLGPLYRWLHSQVGKPWDAIYKELCQQLETRTLSGQHILFHVWGYVERHVELINGVPYPQSRNSYSHRYPLGYWREQLYVHPDTGILCIAKKAPRIHTKKRNDLLIVNNDYHYRQLNNVWYLVSVPCQPLPDVVLQNLPDFLLPMIIEGETAWYEPVLGRFDSWYEYNGQFRVVRKRQCYKKEIQFIMNQLSKK